jgi:hypothetical protein
MSIRLLPPLEVVRETEIGRHIHEIAFHTGKQEGIAIGKAQAMAVRYAQCLAVQREFLAMLLAKKFDLHVPDSDLPDAKYQVHALLASALAGDVAEVRRALGLADAG